VSFLTNPYSGIQSSRLVPLRLSNANQMTNQHITLQCRGLGRQQWITHPNTSNNPSRPSSQRTVQQAAFSHIPYVIKIVQGIFNPNCPRRRAIMNIHREFWKKFMNGNYESPAYGGEMIMLWHSISCNPRGKNQYFFHAFWFILQLFRFLFHRSTILWQVVSSPNCSNEF
jgi:hypothetical protein